MPDRHSSSDEYASRFAGPTGEWFLRRQREAVFRLLKDRSVKNVLDVGGGHAQITPHLVRAGYAVTVLGSTPECARRLEPLLSEKRCSFQVGLMQKIPFPDKSFDAVVCLRQLSHLSEWEKLIEELSRVAKQVVVIDYPPLKSFNCFSSLLFQVKKRLEHDLTRTFRVFRDIEIRKAFERWNFKVFGIEKQFFLPMVVHRVLKMPRISDRVEWVFRMMGLTHIFGSPIIIAFEPIVASF